MRIFAKALILLALLAVPAAGQDYWKGLEAYSREDFSATLVEWRPLAEQGNAYAQSSLGYMYANGVGVTKNLATAVQWYKLSAEQGNASAQLALGKMHANGEGLKKDDVRAVALFRQAAIQGDPESRLFLGRMYAAGRGVEKDYAQAYKWFTLAGIQNLEELTTRMSPAQIERARRLVREWLDTHEQ